MAWVYAVIWVVSLIAVVAMMPKPQSVAPPGLGDITLPTSSDSREIPVLFGTTLITSVNVLWYGNLITRAIRKSGGKK